MWKSTLQSVEVDPQNNNFALLHFLFEHTDGRNEEVMDRFSDTSGMVKYARDYIKKLEQVDSLAEFIANPPIGKIDTDIPPPKEETLDEKKKREYETARQTLIQAKQDLECKLITQAVYDAKVQPVKDIKPVEAIK